MNCTGNDLDAQYDLPLTYSRDHPFKEYKEIVLDKGKRFLRLIVVENSTYSHHVEHIAQNKYKRAPHHICLHIWSEMVETSLSS